MGRLLFNTDSLPQPDRFPAFCEEVVRRYTGLEFTTRDRSSYHGKIELQRAGAIDIGYNHTTPIGSARTRSLIRDGDDSILVTLVKRGHGFQTQRDNDQRLLSGDGVIVLPSSLRLVIRQQRAMRKRSRLRHQCLRWR